MPVNIFQPILRCQLHCLDIRSAQSPPHSLPPPRRSSEGLLGHRSQQCLVQGAVPWEKLSFQGMPWWFSVGKTLFFRGKMMIFELSFHGKVVLFCGKVWGFESGTCWFSELGEWKIDSGTWWFSWGIVVIFNGMIIFASRIHEDEHGDLSYKVVTPQLYMGYKPQAYYSYK